MIKASLFDAHTFLFTVQKLMREGIPALMWDLGALTQSCLDRVSHSDPRRDWIFLLRIPKHPAEVLVIMQGEVKGYFDICGFWTIDKNPDVTLIEHLEITDCDLECLHFISV